MARTPEANFIASVNKYIASAITREKMYNPMRRGTPDMWYSGNTTDLWAEYKWGKNTLSYHQIAWIGREREHGRNVAVIHGGLADNTCTVDLGETRYTFTSPKQVAAWITTFCGA